MSFDTTLTTPLRSTFLTFLLLRRFAFWSSFPFISATGECAQLQYPAAPPLSPEGLREPLPCCVAGKLKPQSDLGDSGV